jgi:hypothetical protein
MDELDSIVDDRRIAPSIDETAFPATPSSYFWSSSSFVGEAPNAWFVHWGTGFTNRYGKSYTYHVRCVRGGQ